MKRKSKYYVVSTEPRKIVFLVKLVQGFIAIQKSPPYA
jgi:hypothetical protein